MREFGNVVRQRWEVAVKSIRRHEALWTLSELCIGVLLAFLVAVGADLGTPGPGHARVPTSVSLSSGSTGGGSAGTASSATPPSAAAQPVGGSGGDVHEITPNREVETFDNGTSADQPQSTPSPSPSPSTPLDSVPTAPPANSPAEPSPGSEDSSPTSSSTSESGSGSGAGN